MSPIIYLASFCRFSTARENCRLRLVSLLALITFASLTFLSWQKCDASTRKIDFTTLGGASVEKTLLEQPIDQTFPPLAVSSTELLENLDMRERLLKLRTLKGTDLEVGRQQLLNDIFIFQMQLQSVLAQMDGEIARVNGFQQALEQRRFKSIRNSTVATFLTSGALGLVGSSLLLPRRPLVLPGNLMQLSGSAAATSFPAYQILLLENQKDQIPANSTGLCLIFDENHEDKPAIVQPMIKYLSHKAQWAPGFSRKEFLLKRWEILNYFPNKNRQHFIQLLCGRLTTSQTMSLQQLDTQTSMLLDLRTVLAQQNYDIVSLLQYVRNTTDGAQQKTELLHGGEVH